MSSGQELSQNEQTVDDSVNAPAAPAKKTRAKRTTGVRKRVSAKTKPTEEERNDETDKPVTPSAPPPSPVVDPSFGDADGGCVMENALVFIKRVYSEVVLQRDAASSEVAACKLEIERLAAALCQAASAASDADARADELKAELGDSKDKIARFEEDMSGLKSEADANSKKLSEADAVLEELALAKAEIQHMRRENADNAAKLEEQIAKEADLIRTLDQHKENERSISSRLDASLAEIEEARRTSDQHKSRIAALEDDAREMRKVSNLVVLEKKLADLTRENDVLKKSLATSRSSNKRSAVSAPGSTPPAPAAGVPDDKNEAKSEDASGDKNNAPDASEGSEQTDSTENVSKDAVATEPITAPDDEPAKEEPAEEEFSHVEQPLKTKTIKGNKYYASTDALYFINSDGSKGDKVASLLKDENGRTKIAWL